LKKSNHQQHRLEANHHRQHRLRKDLWEIKLVLACLWGEIVDILLKMRELEIVEEVLRVGWRRR
jgi:hypothetical protein